MLREEAEAHERGGRPAHLNLRRRQAAWLQMVRYNTERRRSVFEAFMPECCAVNAYRVFMGRVELIKLCVDPTKAADGRFAREGQHQRQCAAAARRGRERQERWPGW